MAENSAYFESITASRSQLLTEEEQLLGQTLISLETTEEFGEDDFYVYSREHFAEWLKMLRRLPQEQQELLLSYYLVGKTQNVLAKLWSSTQTVCSFRIRMAVKLVGTYIMMGGTPDEEQMSKILTGAGLEHSLPNAPLSEVIALFAHCRSFAQVAATYRACRPTVRRAMSQAAKKLRGGDYTDSDCNEKHVRPEELALGVYIFTLIDKADPVGKGFSCRKKAKTARCIVLREPAATGEFRIDCKDSGFDALFVSRANL